MMNRMARGVLTAVTLTLSVDAFLGFIPPWISIAVSVGTLSFFFYVYFPQILQPLFGEAVVSSPVRLGSAICGSAAYFLFHLNSGQLEYYEHPFFYLCLSVLATSLIVLAIFILRKSRCSESEFLMHRLWSVIFSPKRWRDAWLNTKQRPESRSKSVELFAIRYGWIVALILVFTIATILIYLLEMASILFAVLTVASLVQGLTSLFNQRRQPKKEATRLDGEGSVVQTVFLTAGWWLFSKGAETVVCIVVGCLPAFFWVWASLMEFSLATRILWMISLLGCGAYQLYFWYYVLRLLPKLVMAWRDDTRSTNVVLSFPRGGYAAFVSSCYSPLIILGIASAPSDSLKHALLYAWALSGVFYLILLTWSTVRPTKGTTLSSKCRDYILIPLSMFIAQSGFLLWIFLMSHMLEIDLAGFLHAGVALTFSVLLIYYRLDVRRLLANKLGESLLQGVLSDSYPFVCVLPWLITILPSTVSQPLRIGGFALLGLGTVLSFIGISLSVSRYKDGNASE